VYQFVGLDHINYAGSHGLDIQLSTATASTSTMGEIVGIFGTSFGHAWSKTFYPQIS
jgi:hypothetical protein